jgi:hypothetical protein
MKRGKRNIVWSNNNPVVSASAERKRTYHDVKVSDETRSELEGHLVPGALFIALVDFETVKYPKRVTPPPFVELVKHHGHGAHWNPNYNKQLECLVEIGTPIIYAGTVRVEEMGNAGALRVLRHTFIVKNGRYIIRNLNHVKPVTIIKPMPDA